MPHTIRIEEFPFLKFEAILNEDKTLYPALVAYMRGEWAPEETQASKELFEYLTPIKHHLHLYDAIAKVLLLYTNNFIRTTHAENMVFIQLLEISKKLFPEHNNSALVSSLFGAFFTYALSIESNGVVVDETQIGKPRYELIFQVRTLLKQFSLQLQLVTGTTISLDHNTKTLIWVLLQTLINHGTLAAKTRYIAKNKSEVFVSGLSLPQYMRVQQSLRLLIKPATLIQINNTLYLQTQHYSSLQLLIRPNVASKQRSKLTDLSFIQARLNMRLYINGRLLAKILELAEIHFNINLQAAEPLIQRLSTLKISGGDSKAQTKYHELYKLYYLYLLNQQKNVFGGGLFFKYYLDFRGRIYADSPISYTFNKTTRSLFYYGVYTAAELEQFRLTLPDVEDGVTSLILPNTSLQQQYPNLNIKDKIIQYYIYTVFFELGKLKKNTKIIEHGGRLRVHDFLILGLQYFNTGFTDKAEWDEKLEYLSLVQILETLAENIFYKIPIYKDATASALQLLLVLLGPANKAILCETNLTGTGWWYDTYFGIIKRFWQQNPVEEDIKTKFFTRTALKKTIMTHNYQATYLTCLNEFKAYNQLPWDNEHEINLIVIPIFKKFYQYLNDLFDSNKYFFISSEHIVKWFREQGQTTRAVNFTTLDNLFIPLEYTKLTKQRVERLILTKRETILWLQQSDETDETKMFRAIRANMIHSFDGYLVRSVTLRLGYPIITIHDSFGIDILNTPLLISITQKELNTLAQLKMFIHTSQAAPQFYVDSDFVLL